MPKQSCAHFYWWRVTTEAAPEACFRLVRSDENGEPQDLLTMNESAITQEDVTAAMEPYIAGMDEKTLAIEGPVSMYQLLRSTWRPKEGGNA